MQVTKRMHNVPDKANQHNNAFNSDITSIKHRVKRNDQPKVITVAKNRNREVRQILETTDLVSPNHLSPPYTLNFFFKKKEIENDGFEKK